MKDYLQLLFSMLIPIPTDDGSVKYNVNPTKKKTGFTALNINHDALDLELLKSEIAKLKPGWTVSLLEEDVYLDKDKKRQVSPERLFIGPDRQQDNSDEVLNLFG
tara:strand:- start:248 stop:562 length:315 start_codon:yes stop_codon:yes gene_type:complete